ncbi:putative protein kinase RLK-Pelle-CrRLK1L-1 family [Helianthus annuus]|nr:putative protein kinase RLK-Pelle-CrRLK1L-1 family [Helianthus annuus]
MSSSSEDHLVMTLQEYYNSLCMPFEEIASATNNFNDENVLKQGSSFTVYKGQLLRSGDSISIVARESKNESASVNEFVISKNIMHKHIVSLFNISEKEDGTDIFINKHEANGSLDQHLSGPTLTWIQRLHICVGVAHALKYLHFDTTDNHYVIHGNIKSSKILLDESWEPKLHGFGFAVRPKKHVLHLTSKYNGSLPYMDPAYESTRGLTHKSDVFSFGVVLFEILFGREASIQNNDNWYFARLAMSHYEDKKLDDLIHPDLRKQMNMESFNIFAETAYYCLKERRSQRPDMNQVLLKLEKALELQHKHEHPIPVAVASTSSNHLKVILQGKGLDHLKFRLSDIKLATNNFSEACCIGSGGFGKVYKAKLEYIDDLNLLVVEGKNEDVLPKKNGTVAIKRIFSRVDGEQGFLAEIEMLIKCRHPNVVSLLGFCEEGSEMILVYEYVSNGSLDDYLGNIENMTNLTWLQRVQISLDIAHGLHYLHTSTEYKQSIIHRDIKSANILLDDNWVAKIADFGLSKLHRENQQGSTLITNNIAGTDMYLDPEYLSTGGVNQYSLDTFSKVAYQCLAETQSKRPTMEEVINELVKALNFQRTNEDTLHISLKDIKMGTENFSDSNCIGEGRFWKLYEGEVAAANGRTPVFVKRWDTKSGQGHVLFLTELDILLKYKHENIVALVGYCNEMDESISVYQHASNRTLNNHLCDPSLTWMKRLKICLGVANGLEFLHKDGVDNEDSMKHRDIKSGSILLDSDWNAKISNFEVSCKTSSIYSKAEHVDDEDCNSLGYVDPNYKHKRALTEKSDIYSLGVILIEVLCGRLAWADGCENHSQSLGPSAKRHYEYTDNLNDMIFESIKKQIEPESLIRFVEIALECLEDKWDDRPDASDVVIELKEALKLQEDYEIWAPKLPKDYKEIIGISKYSEINNSKESKKDIYDMFSNGILLQGGKVLFSLGSSGQRNEMISARMFTYKNTSYRWQSIQESRFQKVAEMFDISKLKIRIKITTRFLSSGVSYGAYIIFKFCDAKIYSSKPMYVNLKYKKGGENLHAYFATWRDDQWMMIELGRFLCDKKDTNFEVFLESFSRYYCGNGPIYVEGIEFRVINIVKNEEIEKDQQILLSNSNKDQLLSLNEVSGKKHRMLSAMEVLYDTSNVKHFQLQPSPESRFQEVIELLPQQVFRINCKIQSQMLSQDTEYVCYLVFKLSEKCGGLHCPVKVRDLLRRNNKEAEIVYFRTPSPWNSHENNSVPEQREDGWMEVKVWKFNSNHQLKNGSIRVNLKLITYEGTMSGLILCGLEFRPM